MQKYKKLPKIISVFPLSNFIIFPNTSVPLNIFEPRYIEMIDNSMKTDRIIGMIQPKKQKNGIPKLYNVGCAGKITKFDKGKTEIIFGNLLYFSIHNKLLKLLPKKKVNL